MKANEMVKRDGMNGERRNVYVISVGKPKGNGKLGGPFWI
jgi:hypothetical protein